MAAGRSQSPPDSLGSLAGSLVLGSVPATFRVPAQPAGGGAVDAVAPPPAEVAAVPPSSSSPPHAAKSTIPANARPSQRLRRTDARIDVFPPVVDAGPRSSAGKSLVIRGRACAESSTGWL